MIFFDIAHLFIKKIKSINNNIKHINYLKTIYPKKIKKFKGYKDDIIKKRCFIIGNGPSLKKEDLEKLINEDCFACNRIYGLYESIKWRPKYYCCQDYKVQKQIIDDLPYAIKNCEYAFLPWNNRKLFKSICRDDKVNLFFHPYVSVYSKDGIYPEGLMPFSDDIANCIYDGLSITYAMIQIAVYMGYKEIYLIGIDHNYAMKNGSVDASQSYAEGIKPIDMSKQYPPELKLCEISYREASRYCESKGIKIYNATRGGKLEVFERINLDSLFKEIEK